MDPAHGDQILAITQKEDLMGEPLSKQRRKRYRQRQRQKAKIQKAKMAEQGGVIQDIIIPGQEIVAQDIVNYVEGVNQDSYILAFLPEPLIPISCSEDGRKLALFANVLRSIYQRRDCVDVEINILGAQLAALEVRLNAVQKEERDLLELYLREFSDETRYLCRASTEPPSGT